MIIWSNVADKMPGVNQPVFICKEGGQSLNEAQLAYLVANETGNSAWFTGDKSKSYAIASWAYWMPLWENNVIPLEVQDEKHCSQLLNEFLEKLAFYEKRYQKVSIGFMRNGNVYALDYYICGIINRSLSLIYGFETLIRSQNFIAASHLVRPYLDCYLRLSAAWLVEDPDEFATKVWGGEKITRMKDANNNLMTDAYLKEKAALEYPWMKNVYDETSGFVHFSSKHIFNATRLSSLEKRTLTTYIGKFDNEVSNLSKLEAVTCMLEISNCIVEHIFGYIASKWSAPEPQVGTEKK